MKKLAKWFLPHGGNTVFRIFVVSPMAEMLFFAFLLFLPWPKHCFLHFCCFRHGRNTVFRIFVVSPMAEMQISAISGFPPQRENKKRRVPITSVTKTLQSKKAATYSPALHCSTIGAGRLNGSVRNGKRWDPAAVTT